MLSIHDCYYIMFIKFISLLNLKYYNKSRVVILFRYPSVHAVAPLPKQVYEKGAPTVQVIDVDLKWSDGSQALSGHAVRICKSNVYVVSELFSG